jgi:hypothetical protein
VYVVLCLAFDRETLLLSTIVQLHYLNIHFEIFLPDLIGPYHPCTLVDREQLVHFHRQKLILFEEYSR